MKIIYFPTLTFKVVILISNPQSIQISCVLTTPKYYFSHTKTFFSLCLFQYHIRNCLSYFFSQLSLHSLKFQSKCHLLSLALPEFSRENNLSCVLKISFCISLACCFGEGNGPPLQCSCLDRPMDGGLRQAAVHGVAESDTTKRLHFHFSLSRTGEGNGNPLQCSCLENPRDGGAPGGLLFMGSHRVGHH